MPECIHCGHACHCSNGGSCMGGQCECSNCEHDDTETERVWDGGY
jgi:hypothetical protein